VTVPRQAAVRGASFSLLATARVKGIMLSVAAPDHLAANQAHDSRADDDHQRLVCLAGGRCIPFSGY